MNRPTQPTFYLDHAAATPVDPAVLEAMQPYMSDAFANPSSLYMAARHVRTALEGARATLAGLLGAKPTEIIFTSGGTEGNNLAIQGVLRAHPNTHWVTTAIEHDAVLAGREILASEGHPVTTVPVSPKGLVSTNEIALAIKPDTVLISVMMANNEIGTIQPIADIAKLVAATRLDRISSGNNLPLYLHTDAVQAATYLDLHTSRLGVDLLTISGSKVYGPRGTGLLYVRHTVAIKPLQFGGGQERGRRSGTENVAGAVGLAKALQLTAEVRAAEARRLKLLRDDLAVELLARMPGTIINGDMARRLPNNLNLTIPGAEGEALVLYLDKAGIMASTGSACSTGNLDPSHVLTAIGRTRAESSSSLRLTLGRSTTKAAMDHLISVLPQIVDRIRTL